MSDAVPPWTRRDFLKAGALSGAALALGAAAFPVRAAGAPSSSAFALDAGLPLAAVAAVDDALRIWRYGLVGDTWVVGQVQRRADVARAAALVPGTPVDAVSILDGPRAARARAARAFPDVPDLTSDRLAFGLGWLAHHAAGAVLGSPPDAEAALARDVAVLAGYVRPGAPLPDAPAVEALYEALWHRALVRLQTLGPDDTGVESWMHRYITYRRDRVDAARRQAAALAAGRRAEPGFFDADDPIVATARRLRLGQQPEPIAFAPLLASPGASTYARAVAAAAGAFQQGAAYVAGEVDGRTLVGQPHP